MPPKDTERDTRAEILVLARELAQTQSFNWLSFQDLSDRLEIRKASVHYHFPTKTVLGVELMKMYRGLFQEWAQKTLAKNLKPKEKLDAYIEMYRKLMGNCERICPGGTFSLEWNTLPKEIKDEVKGLFTDHKEFLQVILKAGRKAGEFKAESSVDDQVAIIGASLQGALQIARVQNGASAFNAVVRQLRLAVLEAE